MVGLGTLYFRKAVAAQPPNVLIQVCKQGQGREVISFYLTVYDAEKMAAELVQAIGQVRREMRDCPLPPP